MDIYIYICWNKNSFKKQFQYGKYQLTDNWKSVIINTPKNLNIIKVQDSHNLIVFGSGFK